MLISVITVCYNAVSRIERTLRSVLSQDFTDFEYIVVDGASNDGTMDIVGRYSGNISRVVSEQDSGIYQAMNKGVRMATGDFCIFMNAGDMFAGSSVLSSVASSLGSDYAIVMGNQLDLSADWRFVRYRKAWDCVSAGKLFYDSLYHQASFIRRSELIETPYDESLRMVSDWKEAIELLVVKGRRYKGIDVDVAIFFVDGITTTMADRRISENEIVWKEYFTQDFIDSCIEARREYRRVWNVQRYFNHINDSLQQFFYRIKFAGRIDSIKRSAK